MHTSGRFYVKGGCGLSFLPGTSRRVFVVWPVVLKSYFSLRVKDFAQILELRRGHLSGAISGEHVVFTVKTHIFDATIQYLKLRKFRFRAR